MNEVRPYTILGFDNDLKNKHYQPILLLAPHGSGKGVCYVIPSLLTSEDSAIVHDIKLENYQLTSGYRAQNMGHKIFLWNPLNEKTHCYNPLDFISKDPNKIIDDLEKIAHILIKDNIGAKNLFIALVLYLNSNKARIKSFGEIVRILAGNLTEELSDIDKNNRDIHPISYQTITAFLRKDKAEQESIIRSLNNYLAPWHNPLIDHATSKSDFDIADFKKNKSTLYIGLQSTDINQLQPLMSFFYQHTINKLMETSIELGFTEENIGVTLFIDEFYSLGKMQMVPTCMAYLRGYKIKLFLIASDIDSIEKVYGEYDKNIIINNCPFKIIFASNDYKTANYISQLCLDKTYQDIMKLPRDSQLILGDQERVVKKEFYYKDEELKKRIIDPILDFLG